MNEPIHDEEFIKRLYDNFKQAPPPHVWQKIAATLDGADKPYHRGKLLVWQRILFVFAFLICSISLYDLSVKEQHHQMNQIVFAGKTVLTGTEQKPADNFTNQVSSNISNTFSKPITFSNDPEHNKMAGKIYYRSYHNNNLLAQNNAAAKNETSLATGQNVLMINGQPPVAAQVYQSRRTAVFDRHQNISTLPDLVRSNDVKKKIDSIDTLHLQMPVADNKSLPVLQAETPKKAVKDSAFVLAGTKKINHSNGWQLVPFIIAERARYRLDIDNTNNTAEPKAKDDIEQREKHKFSFSAGLLANRQIAKKLIITTGFAYSNIAINIQPQTIYALANGNQGVQYKYVTSSGYAYIKPTVSTVPAAGDSIGSTVAQHHLQYIYVPVMAGFKITDNQRLSVTASAGLATYFLVGTRVRTEIGEANVKQQVTINKLQGLRKVYLSFISDAEIQYRLAKRTYITLLPTFKSAITPITKNNVVKTYPNSFGMGVGIRFHF